MPPDARYIITKLNRFHDRVHFDCGEPSLNEYLHRYALQNINKGVGASYVAVKPGHLRILAYYTVSSGQVACQMLPDKDKKTLPRYPVPVMRLGRLATDKSVRGKGLGSMMLIDALQKAMSVSETLGIFAVEVVAFNDDAKAFYEKYGFRPLQDDHRHLYLSLKTIRRLFTPG